jgi:protein-arginine kinase activator protein McsA
MICRKCGNERPESMFDYRNKSLGIRRYQCRICCRQYSNKHYKNNQKSIRSQRVGRRNKLRQMLSKLKDVPCYDCGIKFIPFAMDFDHLDGSIKLNDLSRLVNDRAGTQTILKEAAKCQIVCATCHRIRTFNRLAAKFLPVV